MKRKSFLRVTAVSLVICAMLAGCGGSKSSSASYDAGSAVESAKSARTAANSDYAAEPGAYDEAALDVGDADYSSDTESDSNKQESTGNIELSQEKIVYTANVSISSKNFEQSVSAAKALAKKYGAIVQSEDYTDSDTSWYRQGRDYRYGGSRRYYVSLRVPSKNYDAFLNSTGEIEGVIDSKNSSAENISQEYYDTAEVIASYEEELARLKELMGEATEMSDILELEKRITDVQTSLNQQRSNLRRMDTDVAYSYVNLDINEVAVYEKSQIKERTYLEKLASAFTESIKEFRIVVGNLILWIVRHWALLLLIILIVVAVLKSRKRGFEGLKLSRKEKKAQKAAAVEDEKMKFVSSNGVDDENSRK